MPFSKWKKKQYDTRRIGLADSSDTEENGVIDLDKIDILSDRLRKIEINENSVSSCETYINENKLDSRLNISNPNLKSVNSVESTIFVENTSGKSNKIKSEINNKFLANNFTMATNTNPVVNPSGLNPVINPTSNSTTNLVVNPVEIFNYLRIPDIVKDLPSFEGNSRTLYDFINNVEEILSIISGIDGTNYGKIILRAIRNKIVGQANEILNMYGTPINWDEIKTNLITHYSDKRNETSLIRDLHLLRQGPETVESFYSKVIEIFSTMMNHIRVHELNTSVITAKQDLYQEMCLNTLKEEKRKG